MRPRGRAAGGRLAGGMGLLLAASVALLSPSLRAAAPETAPAPSPSDLREELERNRAAGAAAGVAAKEAATEAAKAAAEAARLRAELEAAKARAEAAEAASAATLARREALAEARRKLEAERLRAAERLATLIPLAVRLAEAPADTLLAAHLEAADAVAGLVVLEDLSHEIAAESETLLARKAELERLEAAEQAEAARWVEDLEAQHRAALALDAALAEAEARRAKAVQAAREAEEKRAQAAARAASLGAMIATLEREAARLPLPPPPPPPAPETAAPPSPSATTASPGASPAAEGAQGAEATSSPAAPEREAALTPPSLGSARRGGTIPVAGLLIRRFGSAGEAGPSEGVAFRTPPGAHVYAPCAGRVLFADPFRSYGRLVILDCGGGLAFVLAGLGALSVRAGDVVGVGGVLGAMGEAAGEMPVLYVELRRHGTPVDPLPWLRNRG
jgi:septal ring factor EnvC (AmiA/AmiB activator)